MPGRLNLSLDPGSLADELSLDVVSYDFVPRYNVPPASIVPILVERLSGDGRLRRLEAASWGLVPEWAKDPSIGERAVNARSENVVDKPMFRQAIRRRRCALPVPGYYEWEPTEGGKQPWLLSSAGDGPLFMAGIFEFWRRPEGGWLVSTAILTMPAAGHIAEVHDRMPIFLDRSRLFDWMDPAVPSSDVPDLLQSVVDESDPSAVTRHRVSKDVGNVRNDSAELAEPIG